MDGLKPVSKLPPRSRNGTGSGEEIMRMLSEFLLPWWRLPGTLTESR